MGLSLLLTLMLYFIFIGDWIVPKALKGSVDRTMHAGHLFPDRLILGKERNGLASWIQDA